MLVCVWGGGGCWAGLGVGVGGGAPAAPGAPARRAKTPPHRPPPPHTPAQTLERSYLLRVNGRVVERPQHMLMRVSVGIHKDDIEAGGWGGWVGGGWAFA